MLYQDAVMTTDTTKHRLIWQLAKDFNKESKSGTFNTHGLPAEIGDEIRNKSKKCRNLNVRRTKVKSYKRIGVL